LGKIRVVKPRVPSGEMIYTCEFPGCTESFYKQKELETHRLVHPDYKPLECPICKKYRTHKKYTLDNHIRDHTGENKSTCKFPGCVFSTNRASNLKNHMRIKHNVLLGKGKIRDFPEYAEPSSVNTGELPEFDFPEYAEPSSVNTGELPEFDFPLNLGELPIDDISYPDIFGPGS